MRRLLAAAAPLAAVAALTATQAVDPSTLPEGEGRDALVRACNDCHDLNSVTAQRRSRAEWQAIVEDMVGRGAQAEEGDAKRIAAYLAAHVGRANINRAPEEDLKTIIGFTAEEASAIVKARAGGETLRVLDDVRKVPGVNAEKVDEKKDRIAFGGS